MRSDYLEERAIMMQAWADFLRATASRVSVLYSGNSGLTCSSKKFLN